MTTNRDTLRIIIITSEELSYLENKLVWELSPMQLLPQPGMRHWSTNDNVLLYKEPLINILGDMALVDTIPYWVSSLPEFHPRFRLTNGAGQQIYNSIFWEISHNKNSVIPRLPY